MKTLYALIAVFVVCVLAGIAILLWPSPAEGPAIPNPANGGGQVVTPGGSGEAVSIPDLITVSAPTLGASVASPLTITGEARGTWYFEASFPIEVRNSSGVVIAQSHGQAQGEWMTENFVPFSATVTFPPQPKGSTGTIVLRKDNPSGDPARDKSIEIPVVFQ